MKLPVFTWARGYDRSWLRGDVIAGLTVWAVLVPEALAYAAIAGVSPVVGLYAAPGALIFYAAFGSSRHLVTGPSAATAALSAAAVGDLAAGGSDEFVQLTITLALVVGMLALVAGALRLGFLASFISEPVLKGFIIGLALTIMVGQLPKLFGVEKTKGNFFEQLWGFLGELGSTSGPTLLIGVCSLVLVLALKAYAPVVPAALIAVLLGIIAVSLFGLDEHGVAIVGPIESGLPSFGLPDVAAGDYLDLDRSGRGSDADRLHGRARRQQDLRREEPLRGRRQPRAVRSRRREHRLGTLERDGCRRQPVQDGRQRLRGRALAALRGRRRRAGDLTLLFFTGLFEAFPRRRWARSSSPP